MKTPIRCVWLVSLCILWTLNGFGADKAAKPKVVEAKHQWESISYPKIQPWRKEITSPRVQITNQGKKGMQIEFQYELPSENNQKAHGQAEAETVQATFYRGKEEPEKVAGEFTKNPYWGSGPDLEDREWVCRHVYQIPWGLNKMEDAWLRLQFKGHIFWVEIPYGFTRNPEDALKPDAADGRSTFPVGKEALGHDDLVIPWDYVTYRLEELAGGIGLWVNFSNHGDSSAQLVLSRVKGDVREPHASITTITAEGWEIPSRCMGLLLHEYDPIRAQLFRYSRCPSPNETRRWGTVRVVVGKSTRSFSIPTSLYQFVHGHADLPDGLAEVPLNSKWDFDR